MKIQDAINQLRDIQDDVRSYAEWCRQNDYKYYATYSKYAEALDVAIEVLEPLSKGQASAPEDASDAIKQLRSLQDEFRSCAKYDRQIGDNDIAWDKDIEALDLAIEVLNGNTSRN